MVKVRPITWLVLPVLVATLGTIWMVLAVEHYKRATGRQFYGLAALHYSQPEWGMEYHPGGQAIERWTVTVPAWTTLAALLIAAVAASAIEWRGRRWGWHVASVLWHVVVAAGFFLIVAWFSLNVSGVFI